MQNPAECGKLRPILGAIPENYFWWQSHTRGSKLPVYPGLQEAVSPSGRVHWESTANHNILGVFKAL